MISGPETKTDLMQYSMNIVETTRRAHPRVSSKSDEARAIGESNVRNNMDYILSVLNPRNVTEIIKLVHTIATPFINEKSEENNPRFATRYLGGSTRAPDHNALVNDFVPPTGDVILEVLETYGVVLGNLLAKARTFEDFKYIAAFEFIESLTTHPFPDGNGRTSRLMSEVIMAYGRKVTGMNFGIPKFPTREGNKGKLEDQISKWQADMRFYDRSEPAYYSLMRNYKTYGTNFKKILFSHWKGIEEGGINSIRAMEIVNFVKKEVFDNRTSTT
ncbi:MAG: Fic family protein [bacterium]